MTIPRRLSTRATQGAEGFSLIELLVSVTIIVILMSVIFGFLDLNQKEYRSQQLTSEASQGGRSAFEVMTQELNQAGFNPPFNTNRTLSSPSPAGPGQTLLTISGSSTPVTSRIFYGSSLVIGDNCSGTPANCNQETVQVGCAAVPCATPLSTTQIPVLLQNSHQANEPIYDRNFPFPTGILYNERGTLGAHAIADNKIRFFGDVENTGKLYYGEYRLQCPGSTPGSWIDACTTGCMTGPFTLTRYLTTLNKSSVFAIPASAASAFDNAAVSPVVNNIMGTCATGSSTWSVTLSDESNPLTPGPPPTSTVYAAVDNWSGNTAQAWISPVMNQDPVTGAQTTPAIWMKMLTYGSCDASVSPCAPDFESYVTDIEITLTVQESSRDPMTGKQTQQTLETRLTPKNINDAYSVAQNGAAAYLPQTPVDLSTGNTLPLGCTNTATPGGFADSVQNCP